jgi:hypothetical protein
MKIVGRSKIFGLHPLAKGPDTGSIFMKLIPTLLSSALVLSLSAPSFAQNTSPNPSTPAASPAEATPKKEKKANKKKKDHKKKTQKEGDAK